jgi:hypothetical protein
MASYGYSSVTDKGFSAFARDLEEGVWKDISLKKYDVEGRVPAAPLIEAPRQAVWKLRARWSIADLDAALGFASAEQLAALDTEWDASQRALNLFLGSAAEDRDAATREAAGRLRQTLLKGAGIEQNTMSYDAEVDFGRYQISITSKAPLAADAKKVGLGAHLKRIDEATEALAKGIGRGPGQKRAPARSNRIREAMSGCTSTFNAIHDEIGWLLEHTPSGPLRDQLQALHAPFLALLERNPPRAQPAAEPEEAPPAAPVAGDPPTG